MPETIYTIPINEALDACRQDASRGCPICRIYNMLEENELELILGGSMMEPDVRQKTNRSGFCRAHYDRLLTRKNRLGLALILESHLDELKDDMDGNLLTRLLGMRNAKAGKRLQVLNSECYLCGRIDDAMRHVLSNTVYLWQTDRDFREKLRAQPLICLPHYADLLSAAKAELPKKEQNDFSADLRAAVDPYFEALRGDVKHFIRKFDYRFDAEPWGNARDSVERAARFLTGDLHKEYKS